MKTIFYGTVAAALIMTSLQVFAETGATADKKTGDTVTTSQTNSPSAETEGATMSNDSAKTGAGHASHAKKKHAKKAKSSTDTNAGAKGTSSDPSSND